MAVQPSLCRWLSASPRPRVSASFFLLLALAFVAGGSRLEGATPAALPGWSIELVAEAPKIRHPSVVCVAPDGRVFVAEDPMDISTKHADETAGRILCLRPDGRVTVFADKLHAVFGMQYLRGALYVLHNPKLSRFRDDDGVGRDREELIEQTNPDPWALDWNDHVPANFRLAMDGFFYIAVGDKGLYGATDRSGRRVDLHGGGLVRLRPDGTGLEIVARGVRNILDVAMDAEDELFTYDNTDENQWMGRVTHMVDGGFYGYPFDFIPRRPYTLWMFADYGPGAACGALAYNDDALPAPYQGNLFLADFGQRNLRRVVVERAAGTFRVVRDELLFADPPADFRPVGIHETPDGRGFYICDWQHLDNKQEVTVGRLWKLTANFATNAALLPDWYLPAALGQPVTPGLAELGRGLAHPRKAVRLEAQRLLAAAGPVAMPVLRQLLANRSSSPAARRHALWAVDALDGGRSTRAEILAAAAGNDPSVARQAMRQLGERRVVEAVPILARRLVADDPSLRFAAATALGRIGDAAGVSGLLARLTAPEPELWPRFAAWTALNRIGRAHPETWAVIVRGLQATNPAAAEAVSFALRDTYDGSLADALIDLLEDRGRPPTERLRALELLRGIHRQPPPWKGDWWSYHPFRLSPPAHTEAWSATARLSGALRRALRDPAAALQIAAINAAGENRDTAALPQLRELWRAGGTEHVRQQLITALGQTGDADFIPQLISLLADPAASEPMRHAAIEASQPLLETAVEGRGPLETALLSLLSTESSSPSLRLAAIRVSGRAALSNASPALLALARAGPPLVLEPAVRALAALGSPWNGNGLSELATNAPAATRREALLALGDLHDKKNVALLLAAAKNEETRAAAAQALAATPVPAAVEVYLEALNGPDAVARDRARRALKEVRLEVLPQLEDPTRSLTAMQKGELRRIFENESAILQRPFLAGADRAPSLQDYERRALDHPGDPWLGQRLFFDEQRLACVRCHAVHGWGGTVGPEMTTAGAQFPRAALVESILYPSKTVREGYQQIEVELKSGEAISGILKAEDATEAILLEADGRQHAVARDQIVSRRNSAMSLMPEGLQAALSPDEFADLVAYLESLKIDPRRPSDAIPPSGWQPLLSGGAAGWCSHAAPGVQQPEMQVEMARCWHWRPGLLDQHASGEPVWTIAHFGDFSLQCEWRWASAPTFGEFPVLGHDGQPERGEAGAVLREKGLDGGESGLFLRGSRSALIRLAGRTEGSGALEPMRDAAVTEEKRRFHPARRADRPLGQWNRLQVTAQGEKVSVTLNGVRVIEDALVPGLPARGPIGFVAGPGQLQVRDLVVRESIHP